MTFPVTNSRKHPLLPNVDLDRNQTIFGPIETAHVVEIGRAFQFAFERIRPAVIRATHLIRVTFGLAHHRGGMMTTNVEEPAQLIIIPMNNHNWLVADLDGNVVTRFR